MTYPLFRCRVARFSNVEHLSIYFPDNFGNDATRVYYIGLKGEFTKVTTEHDNRQHKQESNREKPKRNRKIFLKPFTTNLFIAYCWYYTHGCINVNRESATIAGHLKCSPNGARSKDISIHRQNKYLLQITIVPDQNK